jgi:hypothetical protein
MNSFRKPKDSIKILTPNSMNDLKLASPNILLVRRICRIPQFSQVEVLKKTKDGSI